MRPGSCWYVFLWLLGWFLQLVVISAAGGMVEIAAAADLIVIGRYLWENTKISEVFDTAK